MEDGRRSAFEDEESLHPVPNTDEDGGGATTRHGERWRPDFLNISDQQRLLRFTFTSPGDQLINFLKSPASPSDEGALRDTRRQTRSCTGPVFFIKDSKDRGMHPPPVRQTPTAAAAVKVQNRGGRSAEVVSLDWDSQPPLL